MAKTSLVVRDGNGNGNSSPTFVFSIIQGYHVYQRIWTPHVGEKAGNEHNRFTVAVLEDETLCTFGHLPQEISKKFIRGRVISVEVTGPRQK